MRAKMPPTVKPKERNCLLVVSFGIALLRELWAVSGKAVKRVSSKQELLTVYGSRLTTTVE